jgi:hypothetical protein
MLLMQEKKSRAMCTIRIWETDDPSRLEKARMAVKNLKGVSNSEADHILQMLTVEYDPKRITLDAVRNSVKKVGRE